MMRNTGSVATSACEMLWAELISRLVQVRRFVEPSPVAVATVSTGCHSKSRWAAHNASHLESLLLSDRPFARGDFLEYDWSVITTDEIVSLDSPFQIVLPPGLRGTVRHYDQDGDIRIDFPAAVYCTERLGYLTIDSDDVTKLARLL